MSACRRRCRHSKPRCSIGGIRHGGHPILRWQISNVAIEMDPAGNRKPSKKRATGHIDGVVSLMMAIAAAGTPAPALDMAALIG